MVIDYKKIDLFGKTLIQKLVIKPPFEFNLPVSDYACFLFSLKGDMEFHIDDEHIVVPNHYSLLLNCINTSKKLSTSNKQDNNELVVISFHPDILKKIYEREMPLVLQQPKNKITNQSAETIQSSFLIQKYIEGLLFYFENPSLVNDDILILKLKEIVLLLSQTQNADTIQVILSQLFSPVTYTFKQIIEAHVLLPVSIEALAQKTNMSVSSFKREFTKLYNDSPANYLKSKRLEKAAEMLLASDSRITDVAFECGFNDLANFTKSFHDKYSVPPSSYRLSQTAKKLS